MLITPDLALARRLEGAEAESCRLFALAAARLYPNGHVRVGEAGGGVAIHYGPSDPLNAVKGVGLNGPVSDGEWDAVEAVFRESHSPVVVDHCPLSDDGLTALLMQRGYAIGSFETVTFRTLDPRDDFASPRIADLSISIVEPNAMREWARVVDTGFADGGEPFKLAIDVGHVRAHTPGAISVLASVSGVPAGGAALSIRGDVAHMSGAAVLPGFRNRGIQQALTAARLTIARERGCTLAKLDVRAGTVSHRNAARAGFQVAYTRPQLVLPAQQS